MRITNKMMTNSYQNNLNSNLGLLNTLSKQLYSGKLIHRPSQNPFSATRIMDYKTEIARKEQYKRNVQDIENFMDVTDSALSQVSDQIKRVRELAIKGENGTFSEEDRAIIADEIDSLIESMVDSLNTSMEDKYIFAGQQTDKIPFEIVKDASGKISVNYNGDDKAPTVEISKGIYSDKAIAGSVFMEDVNGRNIFEALSDLSTALRDGDSGEINKITGDLESFEDVILDSRGRTGTIQKRMELAAEKIDREIEGLTELLSQHGDTDYSKKIIEYKSVEAVYQASLQISSSIIQPSILEFLK